MSPRGRTGSGEAVGTGGRTFSGGAQQVQFQGRSMTITGTFTGGARRIAVEFGEGFTGCSARAQTAKEVGARSTQLKNLVTGRQEEILSVSTGSANCSVREGNVFGGT